MSAPDPFRSQYSESLKTTIYASVAVVHTTAVVPWQGTVVADFKDMARWQETQERHPGSACKYIAVVGGVISEV